MFRLSLTTLVMRSGLLFCAVTLGVFLFFLFTSNGFNRSSIETQPAQPLIEPAKPKVVVQTQKDNEQFEASLQAMRKIYAEQAPRRTAFFRPLPVNWVMNVLRAPEVFCPELIRIGDVDDGGKWICGMSRLPQNCTLYSLGLNNAVSFDRDLAIATDKRCKIYGYDVDEQHQGTKDVFKNNNGVLFKKRIALVTNDTANEVNLVELFRKNGHSTADILKMDIEETEFKVLLPFLKEIQVCQILIEIHTKDGPQLVQFIKDIASFNYLLYSYEPNNGALMSAAEFSFIHESCLDTYGAYLLAKWIPRKAA